MRPALSCTAAKMMVQRTLTSISSGRFRRDRTTLRGKDVTMLTSITRLYQAWKRHEAVKRELSHLTDRELADIGITRSDIDRIATQEAHSG
jgi:uncharacterized protein YjiS (DUF1127 family)